ncbi:MAG: hypothetical protein ACKO5Q_14750, partial [Microcystaceae cyanobacterium]
RMMTLPSFLQESLDIKIQQFEEERTMPLLSNMELRGMERGMERGKEIGKEIGALQNARASVKTVLAIRFGEVPFEIDSSLEQVFDLSVLEAGLRLAVTVDSLEEFQQSLEKK